MKGRDTGLMDEPRLWFWMQDGFAPEGVQKMRPGHWVEEASWPSAIVTTSTLWLNAGTMDADPKAGDAMSVCSPQTFGSAGGDICSFAIPGDMPVDCRIDAAGALVFRGDALTAPLDILGQPEIALEVSVDRPRAFLVGLLVDEAPNGTQTLITRGFVNLMHRASDTAPSPVVPGEVLQATIPLHGIAYRVVRGDRLMVQVVTAYWPILWPAPEPVTATIRPGSSALHLPVQAAILDAQAPRDISVVGGPKPDRPITQVRKGSMDRSLNTDLTTGIQTQRFFIDGGVFGPIGDVRLDDIGTVLGDISERTYVIHPADPLSATARMEQDAKFERDDWTVRIRTSSQQTASATDFTLTARVECWDGDELFHEIDWHHVIPRNGM